ncbi:MAG: bL21 family ribosomal protein, partial [Thermocrinis sp.]|nr:bL21 family ribosomal protein [Thermocrinis sp.]
VFKFRAKKNYKRWRGHRQPYTEIIIKEIQEV